MPPVSVLDPAAKDRVRAAAGLKAEGEIYRRLYGLPPTSEDSERRTLLGQRVRLTGLTARRQLNGKHGEAKSIDKGHILVILEGSGEGVRLRHANLQLAPPAPVNTSYNVGTGQYMLPAYSNNGLPRRCRMGSGALSYSTRRSVAQDGRDVAAPQAGAILPRPNLPTAFREARKEGLLPVRLGPTRDAPLRWINPKTESEVDVQEVDAARWLPFFLEGLRETEHLENAFVALQGAMELTHAAAQNQSLLSIIPATVTPLRRALEVRQSSVICAALKAWQYLLKADPGSGVAFRPHFKQLLPPLAMLTLLQSQPSIGDEFEYSQQRRINVSDLVVETLDLLECNGGHGASALIKSYVPSFQRADEILHRGFR